MFLVSLVWEWAAGETLLDQDVYSLSIVFMHGNQTGEFLFFFVLVGDI